MPKHLASCIVPTIGVVATGAEEVLISRAAWGQAVAEEGPSLPLEDVVVASEEVVGASQ
jgi:hypothetical protein